MELEQQQATLLEMRNSVTMKALVRTAEAFTFDENEKYALLFNDVEILLKIWEFIFVSFNDQDIY